MGEQELIKQRENLILHIAEIKAIANSIDFKKDGRKRFANCKKEIVKAQMEVESISRKIKELRKGNSDSNEKTFDANFVAIAKSILDEDLFAEIAGLANGVTR